MRTDCPPSESWRKLLLDDVPPLEREALEGHLDGCAPCSSSLVALAGRWSLAGLAEPREYQAFGPRTFAILERALANSTEVAGRAPDSCVTVVPPNIPGVAELELVGRGGMGVVFRGREVDLDRPVAVKVLSSSGLFAGSARARAFREALLMASLRHPNVVPVYRSGEVQGLPFLVMEWVGGGTLQARIDSRVLSPREAAETVRDLASAVAEAHALGIIHRDLKPDNVMVSRTDGPATDIHGLGAILFACLIGHAPYAGDSSLKSIVRSARGAPDSIRILRRDIPRDLATIVEKCLQAFPGRRYRSAGELADDLKRFLEGRPISARPVSVPERWLKWARRHPALATSAALLIVASFGGIAGTAYHIASIEREQVKTKAALASATSSRDRARQALGSLTDDAVQRMVQRGKALDEADRAFVRKVRGYYEEWPLEPDLEAALKFRGAGLGRIGGIFLAIDQ